MPNEDKVCDEAYTYRGIEPEHEISLDELRKTYLVSKTSSNLSPIYVKDVNINNNNSNNVKEANSQTSIINQTEISEHTL